MGKEEVFCDFCEQPINESHYVICYVKNNITGVYDRICLHTACADIFTIRFNVVKTIYVGKEDGGVSD